ncbi:MAG: hypothetical protein CSB13_02440 [Chloroflexi bacterium]|nr:MAG: hypothetical protein CSB13_02440 [Chloroflexota bacterium]
MFSCGNPNWISGFSFYQAYGGNVWDRETAVTVGTRLWLIVTLAHSIDWQIKQSEYFADTYLLIEEQDFSGIKVFLYALNQQ